MQRTLFAGAWPPILLTIVISISIGSGACSKSGAAANKQVRDAPGGEKSGSVIAVTVAKTESRNVAAYVSSTGTLVADETSDIAPKAAGKVSNVYANVGQFVGQGALIAMLDDRDARLQLSSAQAGVSQAIAGVRQAEARLGLSPNGTFNSSTIPEVKSANANYQQALAELRQAEANENRYRDLVQTGDVATITYETYRTARDTARAKANSAKELLDAAVNTAKQSNQAIKSAEANVGAARTQVATAQQAIADRTVRAPFAGFISARPVAVGEFVSTASIVATILKSNPIKAQLLVSEADVPSISIGRGVSVETDAYKDRSFAGTVSAVNPAIDPTSRSATIEASIENSNNSLRSGMFVTARITREGGGVGIFAPKTAIFNDQATQSYRAFVIVDGIAKLRVIQLGTEEGDSVQILDGLQPDETVATSNLNQLYEGAKVSS
ncbi:MAG: efflux RND transporter periplasmic adaptor subunit [Pyrinomonadaceae bacterium]